MCYAFAKAQSEKTYKVHTIAFYNVENLFDTKDDPITYDDDRTPTGKDRWTEAIYADKVKNMAGVIAEVGEEISKNAPALIGLAEVENLATVQDLANDPALLARDYGIAHFDSPDRRGIDVALMYQKSLLNQPILVNIPCIYTIEIMETSVSIQEINSWFLAY
jgi:uncharacterized DUF497 family protein